MKKNKSRLIVYISMLFFLFVNLCPVVLAEPVSSPVQEKLTTPSPTDTFIDVLFYRPIGLALIPIGTALFIVSLPFSVTGGNVPTAFNNLVAAPAKYTFARPLGQI